VVDHFRAHDCRGSWVLIALGEMKVMRVEVMELVSWMLVAPGKCDDCT
jgi:hypothetical protein